MKFNKVFFIIFFPGLLLLGMVSNPILAQQAPALPVNAERDSTLQADTLKRDTVTKRSVQGQGLDSKLTYTADSVDADIVNNIVYLFGKSKVVYEDFQLEADYIRLDQKTNTVFAKGMINPQNRRYTGRPLLTQGSEPPVQTDSLVFNYKTKRGKSFAIFTDVEGGYLQAKQFKQNEWGEGHFTGGIYSSCNLPWPHNHFGIHISRGIATDKQIITGPAYLVIEDVPLPLGVPFGFFPKPNKRSGGLLFPTFGEDTRGFFMRDLGYYLGLSDYWDLATRGSIYSKGSYEINSAARYRKNYKYDGSLTFRFASTKTGVEGTEAYRRPAKDFNIRWSHNQNPLANPGTTFSASVDAGTGSYYRNTADGGSYNPTQFANNALSSNISYGKVFGNGLFNFSSSLSHRQDIERQTVFLELPRFSLNMSTLNPFDSKDRVGEEKWYQRISMGYSMDGSNSINTKEYKLFKKEALSQFENGIQHNIPVNMSLNVLKYFQFNSGVQYIERWYLQTIRKRLNPVAEGYSLVTDTISGFSRSSEYSMNSGLSTKVYGMYNVNRGRVEKIRHVMTPSFNFNYRPDFGQDRFGYYRTVQGDTTRAGGTPMRYSIYENGIFGTPAPGRFAGIGFSIDNILEAKVKSKSDTVEKSVNVPILQSLSFTGSYNFAVEEFKLNTIGFSGRTALFKQKLGINFSGTLDPYQIDSLGTRINRYTLLTGRPARLTYFGLSTDFSLNSAAFKSRSENLNNIDAGRPGLTAQQQQELDAISRDPNAFVDFNIPWNISASYSFNYSKSGTDATITNTLNFYGDFNVTDKWKVQYTSGYDFQQNKLSITQFSIYRDLHCWDLSFRWSPIGNYKFYSVDIRVKSSILQDLKLSKRRDFYNNF